MSDAGGGAGSLPRGAAVDVLRWETNRSSRFGTLRITRPRGGIGILQRNLIDNPFRRPQIPAVIASERRSSAPLAAAAAIGSFVGSLAAGGVTQFWPRVAPSSSSVAASEAQASNVELAALSALRTYVEGSSRNANHQFATLADRLDRIERAQAEPNMKLARIAEAVDRLEKERKKVMAAAAEITGTVPNSSSAPAEAKVLPDWILHGVRGRHALVENGNGDLFEITDDSRLPGLGRVEGIKRQDGQWVVVTARGLITSAP